MKSSTFLLRASIASVVVLAVEQVAGLLLKVLLAHDLTPADFGQFNIALSIFYIAGTLVVLGFDQGLVRLAAADKDTAPRAESRAVAWALAGAACAVTLLFVILMLGFGKDLTARLVSVNLSGLPVLALFSCLPLYVVSNVVFSWFRGRKNIGFISYYRVIWRVTPLLMFLGLLKWGTGGLGAAYNAYALSIGVLTAFSLVFFLRGAPFASPRHISKETLRSLAAYSLPLALVTICNQFKVRLDTLLLGALSTLDAAGCYNTALTVASVQNLFLSALVLGFTPLATSLLAKNQPEKVGAIFSQAKNLLSIVTLPVCLFAVFYAEETIRLLFGPQYAPAANALVVLSVCIYLKTFVGPTGGALLAFGDSRIVLFGNILTLAVSAGLNLLLIPRLGMMGAAWANGIAVSFQQFFFLLAIRRKVPFTFFESRWLVHLAACGIAVYVLWRILPPPSGLLTLAAQAAAFGTVGLVAMIAQAGGKKILLWLKANKTA